MKRYLTLISILLTALVLSYCSASKRAASSAPAKLTYSNDLKSVVDANCSPCHIPAKGGNKKAYDNIGNIRTDIDEMVRRIELNPGDRGFMPFRKAHKLPDSTITVFKQWKADGMLE
jgi:hypothetical protein